jgi:hypothetical protein
VPDGIDGSDEEALIEYVNAWVIDQGLPAGQVLFELTDNSGRAVALLDLAWPDGLQPGLSQPVALLIDESGEILSPTNQQGYRCFTSVGQMKEYVEAEVLTTVEPQWSSSAFS